MDFYVTVCVEWITSEKQGCSVFIMEYSSPAVYSTSLIMLHNMYQALHHCFFYAIHLSMSELDSDFKKTIYHSLTNQTWFYAPCLCTVYTGKTHN